MELRRPLSRIWIRLLAFNVLLVFVPAAGILYLDVYERQLLAALERSMVQQGRILAAALTDREELGEEEARGLLERLEQRTTARLRILDWEGRLLADSSQIGPRMEGPPASLPAPVLASTLPAGTPAKARERRLYRLGSAVFRGLERLTTRPEAAESPEFYDPAHPFQGSEVLAALEGRYGATTRISPAGQRSVTLYSAIPIRRQGEVVGAVLVSQSTLRILQDLYDLRLASFKVFLASLGVAALLSVVVATTIVRPLTQLRREAAAILDRRGKLRGRFQESRRRDEIGELARALATLSRRLDEHLMFSESFAADVSHEFKNPLASIRTATEMLCEARDEEERRRFTAMVLEEVARLERLLSSVREVTSIDAAMEQEERLGVALDELLTRLVEGVALRAPAGVALELDAEPELVVSGNPDRLTQVFENLLDNALSFSPPGSTVTIRANRSGEQVVVEVEDQGPGISPEHRDRVFDRFFSYRPGGASQDGHTGLGLAIVKAIVEGYGGEVEAGGAERKGAVVEVRLPASA
jgi:two-component system, OmpR family, sensor histidine kinase ChvG